MPIEMKNEMDYMKLPNEKCVCECVRAIIYYYDILLCV